MNYLKPNFKIKHPANIFGLLFVFLASFVVVYPAHAFHDDGTWQNNAYWFVGRSNRSNNNLIVGPTQSAVCATAQQFYPNASTSIFEYNGKLYCGDQGPRINWNTCNNPPVGIIGETGCGQSPDPAEPQNCQDMADQNQDPEYFELPRYAAAACYDGCAMEDVGGVVDGYESGGSYKSNYKYTGNACASGFDPGSGFDVFDGEDEQKNCYDSNGRLIGQISKEHSCPTLDICYNAETGKPTGTTSQSTSCESGVKYNELDPDLKNEDFTVEQTTSSEVQPDGTVVEETQTTETQTGLDGSTESNTTTNTTTFGTDGSETTETSEKKTTEQCTGPDCKKKQSIANLTACDKSLVCKGDFFACNQIKLEREKACSLQLTKEKVNEWKNSSDYKTNVFGEGDVDANGQLTALQGGSIDITGTINTDLIFRDDGQTASCPAPISSGDWSIDITPFCQFFDAIRYAHLLFEMIGILWFLRRSLVEVE